MTTKTTQEKEGDILGSISTAWNSCIRLYCSFDLRADEQDIVQLLLASHLETAKIRLFAWGKVIGLDLVSESGSVEHGLPLHPSATKLKREDVGGVVLRILLAIQRMLECFKSTREFHGIAVAAAATDDSGDSDEAARHDTAPDIKEFYSNLRQTVASQCGIRLKSRDITWFIHDKLEFGVFMTTFGKAVRSLEEPLPEVKGDVQETMRNGLGYDGKVDGGILKQFLEPMISSPGAYEDIIEGMQSLSTGDIGKYGDYHTPPIVGLSNVSSPPDSDMLPVNRNVLLLQRLIHCPITFRRHANAYWQEHCEPYKSYLDIARKEKGYLQARHPSFALYHRRRFMSRPPFHPFYRHSGEETVLFDIESEPRYENINPGTITVEGFGLEAWAYAEEHSGPKYHHKTAFLPSLPSVTTNRLLRRFNELQRSERPFGLDPQSDNLDLRELFGNIGYVWLLASEIIPIFLRTLIFRQLSFDPFRPVSDPKSQIQQLCSLIDMNSNFHDFTSNSTLTLIWYRQFNGFLRQLILSRELAIRLELHPNASLPDITPKVLASLMVQDLYFRNTTIFLRDIPAPVGNVGKHEGKKEADSFKNKGNAAFEKGEYQQAIDYYTKAIDIDRSSATFHSNRATAYYRIENYEQAAQDANTATQLNPGYIKAWVRRGDAEMKLGKAKRAQKSYQKAIELSGDAVPALMKGGLANADEKIKADLQAIQSETSVIRKHALQKAFLDQNWDVSGKQMGFYSSVIEQQIQGLYYFALEMNWPYMNEVKENVPKAADKLRNFGQIPILLNDWFYGSVLPGKWTAFAIMSCLILSTSSVSLAGVAPYYECGLSLPRQTYWRVRTVLGSVLGCLPGVGSLCGWIGPCPPVDFVGQPSHAAEDFSKKRHHIRLYADNVAPVNDDVKIPHFDPETSYQDFLEALLKPGEEKEYVSFLGNMADPKKWITPQPPAQTVAPTCSINTIQLSALPIEGQSQQLSETQLENQAQYQARIVFDVRDSSRHKTVMYDLKYNPLFVTLPPCHVKQKATHELHKREVPNEKEMDIWTLITGHTAGPSKRHSLISGLKLGSKSSANSSEIGSDVTIINLGSGHEQGAEVMARAWCAERGKNAVIRLSGGPCFACAIRAARPPPVGLGTGVLIWMA
ncbi:hypothetical protein AJ79_03054 [Helicocarpus griseus UAMH5409]|uniref:Prion-inhibition and propagation HeLo domain-containing protein n=1 Tax=Helicocarpus griseus UAMH5409 TaxID=1447875 RepID=A0A2B7Y061_9EURO|nr:hypothetical protein AJ79_03054 [Helicocarpus griseus UAMH5409]